MRTLVIDRKVWLRGESDGHSALLRETDGKRCCVGIDLASQGVPDDVLRHRKSAHNPRVFEVLPPTAKWLAIAPLQPTNDAGDLYEANDDESISESIREQRVAAIFAKHGVSVEFVG